MHHDVPDYYDRISICSYRHNEEDVVLSKIDETTCSCLSWKSDQQVPNIVLGNE